MRLSNAILLFLVATASATPLFSIPEANAPLAPLVSSTSSEVVPDSYIIVFKNNLESDCLHKHTHWVRSLQENNSVLATLVDSGAIAGIKHTYDLPNLKGYSGRFSEDVLEKIRQSDEVEYIERDSLVYATELQRNAPWGLSRISHRNALTLRTFNKYPYDDIAGEGVTVYVIDTGVNVAHRDLEKRAKWGATIPDGDPDEDGNGHGSHVAGTIAGKKYGVAKKANIVAVKVLRSNGSGTMSDVVAGVQWAIEAHQLAVAEAIRYGKKFKGSAANMSLGGGKSRALDDAVNAAVDEGIHFAVAAGNDNRDACDYSPASAENAITVGASTIEDERAWFSNHGKCVDVFAPGKDIQSIWIGSNVATNTISGTSMASPHVAGLAAYYLSLVPDNSTITPKELKNLILEKSTSGKLEKIPKDTPNLLIFNDYEDSWYRDVGVDM